MDLVIFSKKNHLLVSLIFFILFYFLSLYFLYFLSVIFIISFLLLTSDFVLLFINNHLLFFIWDFSCFLRYGCIPIGLSLRTALLHPIDFGKFCFYFHLSQDIFWYPIYFFHWLLKFLLACCLVFLQLCFPQFSSCNWFLVSYHCGQKRCLM